MKHLIVVGSGPAGASAAIYAARGGLNVTVFSKGEGALEKAEKVGNYYGFPQPISGKELVDRGKEQAKNLGAVFVSEEVVGLSLADKLMIATEDKVYKADAVILAMGSHRKSPKVKGLEEFTGNGVSYCAVCDGFFFRDKDVAVLGTGEYANHEAEILRPIVRSVTMIDGGLKELQGGTILEKALFEDGKVLSISGLFVAYGTAGATDLARKVGAVISENSIIVNEKMETSIPGLYAAGDGTGGLLQVAKAVHEGAVAGIEALKYLKKK